MVEGEPFNSVMISPALAKGDGIQVVRKQLVKRDIAEM